jgi:hypothetical protein
MPEFKVEVVKLNNMTKHANADSLSCVEVFGQNVIFRTGDFKEGDLAAYVPYDAVVPVTDPKFAFLKKKDNQTTVRIKPIRLRGVYSEGILVAPPPGSKEGDDVAKTLGVTKFIEPEDIEPVSNKTPRSLGYRLKSKINSFCWKFFGKPLFKMDFKLSDPGFMPKYDLEHYTKYKSHFEALGPEDEVVATEKLHGSSGKFLYHKSKFYVASHNVYRAVDDNSIWWRIAKAFNLKNALKKAPGFAIYGEVYGQGVQDLTYSVAGITFRVFDIYDVKNRKFLDFEDMRNICQKLGLSVVPVLYRGKYDPAIIEPLRFGKSTLDGTTLREGIVIKPAKETIVNHFGRLALKFVSEDYKTRSGNTTERK